MKRLLLILIFILSFQSWSTADDIRDFQIEGISIGDSLLDFYSSEEIDSKKVDYYKDETFSSINIYKDDLIIDLDKYQQIVFGFKSNDKNYVLVAISGILPLNIDNCHNMMETVTSEISNIFENTKIIRNKIKGNFGLNTYNKFELNKGDNVKISCVDYDTSNEYPDHLRIAINNGSYQDWLNNKAYK